MHSLDDLRAGRLNGTRQLRLCVGLGEFPREIFDLADTLEVLDLSGNQLSSLPDDLPRLHRLRILFCSGNPFRALPEVLGRCPQLEMVGFKSCQIERVPAEALPPPPALADPHRQSGQGAAGHHRALQPPAEADARR
jgi:Leucine-rich repeat (LRR) protein